MFRPVLTLFAASLISVVDPTPRYAGRIENADELLDSFLDNFHDETIDVQLQLLTATVKLFLKRSEDTKDLMESVLTMVLFPRCPLITK